MHRVLFYTTAAGNKVVTNWLRSFSKEDRYILGRDLKTVQLGFPLGLPLCRSLAVDFGKFGAPSPARSRRV